MLEFLRPQKSVTFSALRVLTRQVRCAVRRDRNRYLTAAGYAVRTERGRPALVVPLL